MIGSLDRPEPPTASDDSLMQERLQTAAAEVDAQLRAVVSRLSGAPSRLSEAMLYTIAGGGKRIRPVLVLWWSDLCRGARPRAMPAALAVELVHTFSLIHDDLPALDNDDLRRGRPTCHKAFDEATAILAGDALLALAFEVLAVGPADPARTVAMVGELAEATGASGMIGGELADIQAEHAAPEIERVARIHAAKTARLIEAACRLGVLSAGGDASQESAARQYGRSLGLAFQAADDLLDVTGTDAALGKAAGKDARAGKQTLPRAVGVEETQRIMMAHAGEAIEALASFGAAAQDLEALARYVVRRRH